jgi:hypothetical protein
MAKVYEVQVEDADGNFVYCRTLREAKAWAQDEADVGRHPVEVYMNHTAKMPLAKLVIALLMRSGWAAGDSKLVYTAQPKKVKS